MLKFNLLVLGALVFVSASGSAQAPAGAGGFDLRLSDKARNVLVRVERSLRGKVTVKKGLREYTQGIEADEDARWIDQVGAPADRVFNRRTILSWHEKMNGLVKDPGLEGAVFVLTVEDDQLKIAVEGEGRASEREQSTQGLQAYAAGLFADLPEAAVAGSAFEFDGADLTATLTHMEEEILDFKGTMKLLRVDAKANRAYLTGSSTFKTVVKHRVLTFEMSWKADYAAEVDLNTKTIARITAKGNATPSGSGEFKGGVSGGVTFTAEGESEPVKDVAPYVRKKAAFRTSTRELFGIEMDLPSCWTALPQEANGIQKFRDTRAATTVLIEVANIDPAADPASDEFLEEFTKIAKDAAPDAKVWKERLSVGEGAVFSLTADDGSRVKGCVVKVGGSVVRLRLVGSAAAIKKADGDYQAAIASLRPGS